MADQYFSSVVLLAINNNGANGTTVFTDQSASAKALTAVGNAAWSSAAAPSGLATSAAFDGTGDSVTADDSADWSFGTGDFTIELWGRSPLINRTYQGAVVQWGGGASNFGLGFGTQGAAKLGFLWGPHSVGAPLIEDPDAYLADTFYAVAVTRSGNTFRIFRDGVKKAEADSVTTGNNSTAVLSIGNWINGGNSFSGYIAAVRITKGVARYTGDYTPPSLPLPTSATDPVAAGVSGVRKSKGKFAIRLSDVKNRADTAEFLKAQLKLKHFPQDAVADTNADDERKKRKEARQLRQREAKMRADAAAEKFKAERLALEASLANQEEQRRLKLNNDNTRALLLMAAAA